MKTVLRLGACGVLAAFIVSAQTIDDAERLWKARRYKEAFNIFTSLEDRDPKNIRVKMDLGRMLLEFGQPGDAADSFNKVLEINKEYAPAYLGLALTGAAGFEGNAADLARTALKYDSKLVEAQELLARLALEDNDNPKAEEEAKKALAMDANAVEAKAVLASMDLLADKKETPWDPHNAEGYETIARFFVLNRRYDEGIAYYRKAVALDPKLYSARSQLGVNLMRMGQDDEAYQQLQTCYDAGYTGDSATTNSLRLLEKYKKFGTYGNKNAILKMDKKEGDLLSPYFESEMARVVATYEKKYKFKLQKPVQIEVYPDHEDFAVRTLGLPGLGALGVTFGYTIAMDSPSGRTPGEFHWASTLWHEMSHVFTLSMTNSHVPRWFTEGLAVHEETAASPEWGDRLNPDDVAAIKDRKLLPIAELDRGFVHPKSPSQIGVSYFQGGKICDFITEKYGWDTILAMLRDFAGGADTASVVRKELKMEPAEFDKQFFARMDAEYKDVVANFDGWMKRLKGLAALAKAKDNDGVIKEGTAIRDLFPEYVEHANVYQFLADAYLAKGDKQAAIAQLDRYTHIGGRDPELLKQLAKLLADEGKKKEAADVLERLNFIYPMDNEQHQRLGALWLDLGNINGAIREFHAVAVHHPIDAAEANYQLARAYKMNRQPEQARDALLSALEAAPGYRPAQKLLLELSSAESGTTPDKERK